jgi:PhnB protein
MIAQPSPDYRSRIRHAEECAVARAQEESPYVIDGVHVYVPDVQAHHKKALTAGARILSSGVEEGPVGRLYRAADLEGHRWMFMEQQ